MNCSSHNTATMIIPNDINNINNTNDLYLDNDGNRFNSVLIEAFLQLITWHFVISYAESYVAKHCKRKKWFIQWAKKPDGLGGEFGGDRVIAFLGACIQHTFSGILLCLAYYLSGSRSYTTQLFITGALGEFAYEALDVKNMIVGRYITKSGVYSAKRTPSFLFVLMLMHHSGAFLSILPVCIYYADNAHVHQIGLGLLGFTAWSMIAGTISSSRDITDLRERGQFMVMEVFNCISMIYFRWIVAVPGMYWFLYEEWGTMSVAIRIAMIAYMVFIKLFDLMILVIVVKRTCGFLVGEKGMKNSTKITVCSLKRSPSTPFHLLRMKSAPLF